MIVVKVELWSAITGVKSELARMHIVNDGTGTGTSGNYDITTLRGRSREDLDKNVPNRTAKVIKHPRLAKHVWELVGKALVAVGYIQ